MTDPCGTCRRAGELLSFYCFHAVTNVVEANYEAGTIDYERELAAQRRHANLDAKMRKPLSEGSYRAVGTVVPIHELQAVRTAHGIGHASQHGPVTYCTVYYECRRSDSAKHVDQMLGTGVISFPEINTMLGKSALNGYEPVLSDGER